MRVIAGTYRSRPLRSLSGINTRPTSDRLRETLFNVLMEGSPDRFTGTNWLDLFAGTGAVGIEALSRGAAYVVFVESDRSAGKLIYENLKTLGISKGFQIIERDVVTGIRKIESEDVRFDYVFLDPPYQLRDAYQRVLHFLSHWPNIDSHTTVIAEHDKRFDPGDAFDSLVRTRRLVQGDSALSFYSLTAPAITRAT